MASLVSASEVVFFVPLEIDLSGLVSKFSQRLESLSFIFSLVSFIVVNMSTQMPMQSLNAWKAVAATFLRASEFKSLSGLIWSFSRFHLMLDGALCSGFRVDCHLCILLSFTLNFFLSRRIIVSNPSLERNWALEDCGLRIWLSFHWLNPHMELFGLNSLWIARI